VSRVSEASKGLNGGGLTSGLGGQKALAHTPLCSHVPFTGGSPQSALLRGKTVDNGRKRGADMYDATRPQTVSWRQWDPNSGIQTWGSKLRDPTATPMDEVTPVGFEPLPHPTAPTQT
jgi:hypothetical protein